MELSDRLQAVAAMVSPGKNAADIGCDHGYMAIYLTRHKISPKVIAMDVNKGPLERARENIALSGLGDYIETRLSDGADALQDGEAQTLICAGMGGRLIVRILERALSHITPPEELVLQPQSEIFLVREFLRKHGYVITREDMVCEEGKYYPVMRAEQITFESEDDSAGHEVLAKQEVLAEQEILSKQEILTQQEIFDWYGSCLLQDKHPVMQEYLQKEKEEYIEIMGRMSGVSKGQQERLTELKKRMARIERALAYYEM